MSTKADIIIATGGTGGHMFPSISLAKFLNKDHKVEIFTDERGFKYLENDRNIKVKKIISTRVFDKNFFYVLGGIIKLLFSVISSFKLLIEHKPKIIIGMGGYSSFAVCIAGFFLNIPILIYENNLIIGRSNKLLLPFSKKILVSTNSITGIDKKYQKKIFFTGFLLRENILNLKKNSEINRGDLSILIIGGSQSAKAFGDQIPSVIKKCHEKGLKFNVYQQCLDFQKKSLVDIYEKLNIKYELFSFTKDLSKYYQKCDLAISRCGASSIAELINSQLPFIAVPLPSSMDNHQLKNALYFEDKGYCYLLEQKYLSEKLLGMLQDAYNDRNKLYQLKKKMNKHSDKESLSRARRIIQEILNGQQNKY